MLSRGMQNLSIEPTQTRQRGDSQQSQDTATPPSSHTTVGSLTCLDLMGPKGPMPATLTTDEHDQKVQDPAPVDEEDPDGDELQFDLDMDEGDS